MQFLADTFSLESIQQLAGASVICGATSNTAIAAKEGVMDYLRAAESLADIADQLDVSISPPGIDTVSAILRGAMILRSIGPFRVKVPVSTSSGEPTHDAILKLRESGIPLNITAVLDASQLHPSTFDGLQSHETIFVSIFAGRCRDIGRDPGEVLRQVREKNPQSIRTVWASTRDLQSLVDAEMACSDYATARPELLLQRIGLTKSPDEATREVLREFQAVAEEMGYATNVDRSI